MSRLHLHPENHLVERIGWLRAAVLGANDGIVSTASLIVGVAAAAATPNDVLLAGVAGLVAGAMSMAAGEYVSVSSQADTEKADLARERRELVQKAEFEREELAAIYVERGLNPIPRTAGRRTIDGARRAKRPRARRTRHIRNHRRASGPGRADIGRDVLPGAAMPLLMAVVSPEDVLIPSVSAASLAFLALLGAIGAKLGGAHVLRATVRVTFWGALSMALTAGIGKIFETVI